MILVASVIVIFLIIFYFTPPNKDREDAYLTITLGLGLITIGIAFGIYNAKKPIILEKEALIIFGIVSVFFLLAIKRVSIVNKKIMASQIKFWNIHPKEMLDNNKHNFVWKAPYVRKISEMNYVEEKDFLGRPRWKFKRSERIIKVGARKESKDLPEPYLYEMDGNEKVLGKIIYNDIRRFNRYTVIGSLKYFESDKCTRIHGLILSKLIELNVLNERYYDFDKILAENRNILEFFFLDLWERLATDDIIGVASLYSIASEKREFDLLGAMDGIINSNIPRDGIELLAHYYNFKGRILK